MEPVDKPQFEQKPLTRNGKLMSQKLQPKSFQNSALINNLQTANSDQIDSKEDIKLLTNYSMAMRRETLSRMAVAFLRPVPESECIYLSSDDEN
jgi:hypothetical protein